MHYGELPQGYEEGGERLCRDIEDALRCLYALGFCKHSAILLKGNAYSRTSFIYTGWIERDHLQRLFNADTHDRVPGLFIDLCERMFKTLCNEWGSESFAHVSRIDVPQKDHCFRGYVLCLHLVYNYKAGLTSFTSSRECLHALHPHKTEFQETWLYDFQGSLE